MWCLGFGSQQSLPLSYQHRFSMHNSCWWPLNGREKAPSLQMFGPIHVKCCIIRDSWCVVDAIPEPRVRGGTHHFGKWAESKRSWNMSRIQDSEIASFLKYKYPIFHFALDWNPVSKAATKFRPLRWLCGRLSTYSKIVNMELTL